MFNLFVVLALLQQQPAQERIVVKFLPRSSPDARQRLIQNDSVEVRIPQIHRVAIRVPPNRTPEEACEKYINHPLVDSCEPEVIYEPVTLITLTPNDIGFPVWQRPLQRLNAEAAWDITTGIPSITVGTIDSGADMDHPEFITRVASGNMWGRNFKTAGSVTPDFDDSPIHGGHGTAVTGIIAAEANNTIGIAGTSWNNSIFVAKTGFGFDTAVALVYAADNGVNVISMSFGSYIISGSFQDAAGYAFDRGVVMVGAAGNLDTDSPFFPASYSTVITVTGLNGNNEANGAAWGEHIDISAPISGILTTVIFENDPDPGEPDGLVFQGGTSMSAPFVAGAAGLMLSVNPNLTPDQVKNILNETADDVLEPGFDVFSGHGMVDFFEAVKLAEATTELSIDTTPPFLAEFTFPLNNQTVEDDFVAEVLADDDFRVTHVDFFIDGVFLRTQDSARGGEDGTEHFGWFRANVDVSQFGVGRHDITANVFDFAGHVTVATPGSFVYSICGNSLCELNEDCDNCRIDCFVRTAQVCGNGFCELAIGEDCENCPEDCSGETKGTPGNRFCCGLDVGCGDERCNTRFFRCETELFESSCCGDGICNEMLEQGTNCTVDCSLAKADFWPSFDACFTGPLPVSSLSASCQQWNLEGNDDDVDLKDWTIWLRN